MKTPDEQRQQLADAKAQLTTAIAHRLEPILAWLARRLDR